VTLVNTLHYRDRRMHASCTTR